MKREENSEKLHLKIFRSLISIMQAEFHGAGREMPTAMPLPIPEHVIRVAQVCGSASVASDGWQWGRTEALST